MDNEYKHFYYMMAKHNPFPTNCLPISTKHKQLRNLNKLLQINQSIADIVSTQRSEIKICKPELQINIEQNLLSNRSSSKRIHNFLPHFSEREAKSMSLNKSIGKKQERRKDKYKTLQEKANSTLISRRKDLYDNTIEKYMETKYDSEELIDKYLTNREKFINQACQQIKKQLKQEYRPNRSLERNKYKKERSSNLPKIQQFSAHFLKKSQHKFNDGVYIQQVNLIKRSQQLQYKNRTRNLKIFKKKMHLLQNKLAQLRHDTNN